MEKKDECNILFADDSGCDCKIIFCNGVYTANFVNKGSTKFGGHYTNIGGLFRGIIRHKRAKKEPLDNIIALYRKYLAIQQVFCKNIIKLYEPLYEIKSKFNLNEQDEDKDSCD